MNKPATPTQASAAPVWFVTGGSTGFGQELARQAIVEAVASGRLPHHLLLRNHAFEGAMAKIDELRQDFMSGEKVARDADFPRAMA
jgi:NAD(P)-dependent dehydrogenase (short-subunit alcohol dehydrogenase family)